MGDIGENIVFKKGLDGRHRVLDDLLAGGNALEAFSCLRYRERNCGISDGLSIEDEDAIVVLLHFLVLDLPKSSADRWHS